MCYIFIFFYFFFQVVSLDLSFSRSGWPRNQDRDAGLTSLEGSGFNGDENVYQLNTGTPKIQIKISSSAA